MSSLFIVRGSKDIDFEILNFLNDKDLLSTALVSKKANHLLREETFWMRRVFDLFHGALTREQIQEFKRQKNGWKKYYIDLVLKLRTRYPCYTFAVALEGKRYDIAHLLETIRGAEPVDRFETGKGGYFHARRFSKRLEGPWYKSNGKECIVFRNGKRVQKITRTARFDEHAIYGRDGNVLRTDCIQRNTFRKMKEVWHLNDGTTNVKRWFADGRKRNAGYYSNSGKRIGTWREWNRVGQVKGDFLCLSGVLVTSAESRTKYEHKRAKYRKQLSKRMPRSWPEMFSPNFPQK
jgi:hypothetical protein